MSTIRTSIAFFMLLMLLIPTVTATPNKDIKTNLTTPIKPLEPKFDISNAKDVTKDIMSTMSTNNFSTTSASGDATNLYITVRGLEYTRVYDPSGYCENRVIYSSWLTGDIWYNDCWYFEKGVIHAWYLNDFVMLPITVEVWNTATLPEKNIKVYTKIWSCTDNGCYVLFDSTKYTDINGITKFPFKISKTKYQQYGKYYYVSIDVWDSLGNRYDYDKDFYLKW